MSWIGLDDRVERLFDLGGLGTEGKARRENPDDLLARGTLLMEFRHNPALGRQNLLRYTVRDPWPASLIVCLDPDGTVQVLMGQGDRHTTYRLRAELPGAEKAVIFQYSWDAPARRAVLSLRVPEKDALCIGEFAGPLPISVRDARNIVTGGAPGLKCETVVYMALSDSVEPAGPIATIEEEATVETPTGAVPIGSLRLGQFVLADHGDVAQVRWIGSQELPARGRYAPCALHAPYYGLARRIDLASEQTLRLSGSRVEYQFGEEEVSASVRHLMDGHAITCTPGRPVVRYYHVLLERLAVLDICGAPVESLDPRPFHRQPELLRHSILRDLPAELLPEPERAARVPLLRGFEALTLAH